ncbi:hypothetical protein [Paenibacillus sp. HJGM_3]|uniref:hypothetical protein n=1 Tax=Paenibacillus sp. HJGM_3 TaxID=3379816 RepID=UPI00385F001A
MPSCTRKRVVRKKVKLHKCRSPRTVRKLRCKWICRKGKLKKLHGRRLRSICCIRGPRGLRGRRGRIGAAGPQGPAGPAGPQGASGTQAAYGNGSAGELIVPAGQVLDLSTPSGAATLPAGSNLQFSRIEIAGTLILPSGLVLQSTGPVVVTGSIVILPGAQDSGKGTPNPGVSLADAGPYNGGIGLSPLQSTRILSSAVAGGAGSRVLLGGGGEGGGGLTLLAQGPIQIASGAVVSAAGRDGTNPQTPGRGIVGSGGGAGGTLVIASKQAMTIAGTLDASGGDGADGWDGNGGDGEGGGGGGGGGIIYLLSSSPPAVTGTLQVNGGQGGANASGVTGLITIGGGGGANGGNGGNGGGTPVTGQPPVAAGPGQAGQVLQTVTPEPEALFLF